MRKFLHIIVTMLSVALFAACQNETPTPDNPTPEDPKDDVKEMTLEIEVSNITPYSAKLAITPSNDEESYACVFLAKNQISEDLTEQEKLEVLIEQFMPATFTGYTTHDLKPLMPATDYMVMAFGIKDNQPTTKLYEVHFTSAEASEASTEITGFELLKVFDVAEIIALDRSYKNTLGNYECLVIVEAKTNVPCDTLYFWWYEDWMKVEYTDEAFLEDLLMYDPANNPELMGAYYEMYIFFAGVAEDKDGNISEIFYGEDFMITPDMVSPAEEFLEMVTIK